jgi:hypothetical protein
LWKKQCTERVAPDAKPAQHPEQSLGQRTAGQLGFDENLFVV